MVTLRAATKKDRAILRRLIWRARINPLGIKWARFTVAEKDGEIVGCVQLKPHPGDLEELSSLVVLPGCRGHGIGGRLIEHCIRESTGELFLVCGDSLEKYYLDHGFSTVPIDEMTPYYKRFYRLSRIFWPLLFSGTSVILMKLEL